MDFQHTLSVNSTRHFRPFTTSKTNTEPTQSPSVFKIFYDVRLGPAKDTHDIQDPLY